MRFRVGAPPWEGKVRNHSSGVRTLLSSQVDALPDEERLALVSRVYQRQDGTARADILADIEEDLTGRTRERVITGLHAGLD